MFSRLLGGVYCIEETLCSPLNNDYTTQLESWQQTPSYAPTPGNFRFDTPSFRNPSPGRVSQDPSTPSPELLRAQVSLSHNADWDDESILYIIEWKVTINNRVVSKDTEQDLELKPRFYWQAITEKAKKIIGRKKNSNQRVRLDDITIVVSVNDRKHRDLTKQFEYTDVDWTAIEKQLLLWRTLFHAGKELRLSITINYLEDSNPSPSRTDKRGPTSTTARMLREREAQIEAECSSGQPAAWRDVYKVMRCPGRPCHHNGQFCWLDPAGKKHYNLLSHHLRSLVQHVEDGNVLETHDDVPYEVRERLYAEDEKQREKGQKSINPANGLIPPINIHFLPAQSPQTSTIPAGDIDGHTSRSDQVEKIDIPGLFEVALDNYTDWQLTRVDTELFKDNIKKARDITLENCLDLSQVYCEVKPEFYVEQGVKIGVARRFVRDISLWVKTCAHKDNDDSVH